MNKIKEAKIEIEEPIFEQLRSDINAMLRRTIGMMTMKNTEDAVITIKIPVHIERQNIPDGGISREAPVPSFKHEISSVMQVKDKMSGQTKGEYELVFDEDGNPMYRNINNGQTSIWDDDGRIDIEGDSFAEQDARSLEAPPVRGLPAAATEEAEDADFDEIPENVDEIDEDVDELPADEEKPFDRLMKFKGEELTAVEEDGEYKVLSSAGEVIISTAFEDGNPFKVDPKKVKNHVGHKLICTAFPEGEEGIESIEIWCDEDDCGDFIFGIQNPYTGESDYEYDEPEK